MRRHINYLFYVLRHKWFVFEECLKLGVPLWIAITHDWDKFLPSMWLAYARCFYAPDGTKQYKESHVFQDAWNSHQKRNKHHWQYWLITWDRGSTQALIIPQVYMREMISDWRGAGKALGMPDTAGWYKKNASCIKLNPVNRVWIEAELDIHWDDGEAPPL